MMAHPIVANTGVSISLWLKDENDRLTFYRFYPCSDTAALDAAYARDLGIKTVTYVTYPSTHIKRITPC